MSGPGKKDKSSERDAAADFFGDDDLGWFEDDLDDEPAPAVEVEAPIDAAAAEGEDVVEDAPAPPEAPVEDVPSEPEASVEDEPAEPEASVEDEPEPAVEDEPAPAVEEEPDAVAAEESQATEEPEPEAIVEEVPEPAVEEPSDIDPPAAPAVEPEPVAAAETSASLPKPPVAPPPPPPYKAPKAGAAGAGAGYLDSILPKTLEPPRVATTPPPVGGAPEMVEAIGVEPTAGPAFTLPTGPDAWREVLAVLDAEAERTPDDVDLIMASAHVRRHRLADLEGALERLQRAKKAGAEAAAVAWERVACAVGRDDEGDAWAELAELLEGRASADAWRRVAAHADAPATERAALEHAVQADPEDLLALERLVEVLRAYPTEEALAVQLDALAQQLPPRAAAGLRTELGHVLMGLDRSADAASAWREAVGLDADRTDAWAALGAVVSAAGDPAAIAAHHEQLATLDDASSGHELWLAGRAWRAAGDLPAALRCFRAAIEQGAPLAALELEACLLDGSRPEAVVEAVEHRVAQGEEPGPAWYRAGLVLERAGDGEGALAALRRAQEAGFAPAAESVTRALRAAGSWDDLVAAAEARVGAWDVPRLVDQLALAEACELRDPASEAAVTAWRTVAERDELDGFRGLARVARRAGDQAALAIALEALAEREPDPEVRAARAHERGVLALAVDEAATAATWLERALEAPAGAVISLEALVEALLTDGRAADAAGRLEARAAAVDDEAATDWLMRAVDAWERAGDVDAALAALDTLLGRSPEHEPARRRLATLAGSRRTELERARLEAEGSEASRLAAATLALLVGEEPPEGALFDSLRLLHAARSGDAAGLLAYVDASTPLGAAATVALAEADRAVELLSAWEGDGSLPLVRAALAHDRADLAATLASGSGLGDAEVRRLAAATASAEEVLASARAALAAGADTDTALEVLAAATAADDAAARREAHAAVVEHATQPALTAAHGFWLGALQRAEGEVADAAASWRAALEARPGALLTFRMIRQSLVELGDADALAELYDAHGEQDARGRAEAIEDAGGDAVAAWRVALEATGALHERLALEVALANAEAWQALFEAWTDRMERAGPDTERARLEAKRRWVLAEKLAETDIAWELYQQLHEESPDDTEVIESLARIAGARGEIDTAVGFLSELVSSATDPRDAARFQRRIAEAHLGAEQDGEAREAFLAALDHHPEDVEALQGLRRVAERTEDWETLQTALKREAGLVSGTRRVEVQREMARNAQDRLDDADRALEAWRTVLEADARDEEALRRLLELGRAADDLELELESGRALATVVHGEERSGLLTQLGLRCETAGRREDAVHFFEQAVAAEVPDLAAAQRLEEIYRDVNDHQGVVRALLAQEGLLDEVSERVAVLRRAAEVESLIRHDREAAHRMYARILELDADHEDALRFESVWLYDAGRHADALPLYERLESIVTGVDDLDDYDVRMEVTAFFFRFGEMLRSEGRLDDARRRYEQALELNPTHLPTLKAVGPMYVEDEAWKQAGDVYQQLLQLTGGQGEPRDVAETFTMLGLVERALGRTDKAAKRFTRALEAFANFVPALKGLALVHEDKEDWQALLTAYNSVIYNATVPQDVIDAYMTKGRVLDEAMERPDKAAQHYERSLAFDAAQPVAHLRLAEMALRREAWEEAIDYASRGLVYAEDLPAVAGELHLVVALGRQCMEQSDPAAAEASWEQACSVHPPLAELAGEPLSDPSAAIESLRARLPR